MAGSVNPQDVVARDDAHHERDLVFEALDGTILAAEAIDYLVAARGREDHVEADAATGEAVIG